MHVWFKSFDHFPALVPGFFCLKFGYNVCGAEEHPISKKYPNTDFPAQSGGIFFAFIAI